MKQNGENMLSKDIRVEAFWDEEAHVWVASSNDVPGLITEADTMEQLMQKLKIFRFGGRYVLPHQPRMFHHVHSLQSTSSFTSFNRYKLW